MIDVIDYGSGNLFSVLKALQSLGAEPRVVKSPGAYRGGKILIPGVGAFGDAMAQIRSAGFAEFIAEQARLGKPVLGICVGMQVLFSESEESPGAPGLDLFEEQVERFPANEKVPHMGWNQLEIKGESKLLRGVRTGDYVYFAHSYCVPAEGKSHEAAVCHYSVSFAAVIEKDNLYGVQFHPEKSQRVGMNILKNFVERC
jgi:glutamine amidotransferase